MGSKQRPTGKRTAWPPSVNPRDGGTQLSAKKVTQLHNRKQEARFLGYRAPALQELRLSQGSGQDRELCEAE